MTIPVYPRGRPPDGELRAILDEIFIKADVDLTRSIEPPMSSFELGSAAKQRNDQAIVDRFVTHALRAHRVSVDRLLPVIPWRATTDRADNGFRKFVTSLVGRLVFLPAGRVSKSILLLEDIEALMTFQSQATDSGNTIMGEIHKGGVWTTDVGQFFLITWSPTTMREDLGRRLKNFLASDSAFFTGKAPSSPLPPPPRVPSVQMARRRPSSTTIKAVNDATLPTPLAPPPEAPKRRS